MHHWRVFFACILDIIPKNSWEFFSAREAERKFHHFYCSEFKLWYFGDSVFSNSNLWKLALHQAHNILRKTQTIHTDAWFYSFVSKHIIDILVCNLGVLCLVNLFLDVFHFLKFQFPSCKAMFYDAVFLTTTINVMSRHTKVSWKAVL